MKKSKRIVIVTDYQDQCGDSARKERTLITFPALFIMVIAIASYLIVYILKLNHLTIDGWPYLIDVITNIGNILMAVSIGTLIIDFFGFIDYMKSRLRDVLIEDDYLNILSIDQLENLKNKIELKTLYRNIKNVPENSLFNTVQNEIRPLLKMLYYQEYITTISCELIDDKYIKKTVSRTMTFNCLDKSRNYSLFKNDKEYCATIRKIDGINETELFKIEKFTYNSVDYRVRPRFKPNTADKDYDLDVFMDLSSIRNELKLVNVLKKQKNDHKKTRNGNNTPEDLDEDEDNDKNEDLFKKYQGKSILNIKYVYYVPLDDKMSIFKVTMACENYCIHLNYDSDHFKVSGEGFGFMDRSPTAERKIIRDDPNSLVIRFNNWILPGDGVFFTIEKKNNQNNSEK